MEFAYTPEQRPQLISDLRELVRPYYRPLHYHNLEHAVEDTLGETLTLVEDCRRHGIEVSWEEEANELAASACHDTRFYEPLANSGFSSKEQRSCADARLLLPQLGYSESRIESGVIPPIAATEPGVRAITLAQKRERRADIKNLAYFPVRFLSSSVKLFYESKLLHAEAGTTPLPWPEFVLKQHEFLKMLLEDDLSMPYENDNPFGCTFMREARQNAESLTTEAITNGQEFCRKFGAGILRYVPVFRPEDLGGKAA